MTEKKITLKKQYKIAIGVVLAFLFLFTLILPGMVNPDKKITAIQDDLVKFVGLESSKIEKMPKLSVKREGKSQVHFFPTANIVINDVVVENLLVEKKVVNVTAAAVKVKVGFFALLSGNIKVKAVELINPKFHIKNAPSELYTGDKKVSDLNNFSIIKEFFQGQKNQDLVNNVFDKLYLRGAHFSFYGKGNLVARRIDNSNISIVNVEDELLNINGTGFLNNKEINLNFILNTKGNKKSRITFFSDLFTFQLDGNFEKTKLSKIYSSDFEGGVDLKINNLKDFSNWFFVGDKTREVEFNKDIQVSAKIKNNKGILNVSDLKILSSAVEGGGYIDGNLIKDRPELFIKLNMSKVDLDSIYSDRRIVRKTKPIRAISWIDEINDKSMAPSLNINSSDILNGNTKILNDNKTANAINLANESLGFFDSYITRRADVKFDFDIKEVGYLKGSINDLTLKGSVFDSGKMKIDDLSLKAPGNTNLSFSGYSTQAYNMPSVRGRLTISGDSLVDTLEWLDLYRFDKSLENLPEKYNLDGDLIILSNKMLKLQDFKLRFDDVMIGGEVKKQKIGEFDYYKSNLYSEFLDLDRVYKIEPLQLSTISNMREKLLWLNSFDSNSENIIRVKNLVRNGINYNDFLLHLRYGQGYLEVLDSNIDSERVSLGGRVYVDITSGRPILNLDGVINKMIYVKEADSDIGLSDLFFSMPSLDNFAGNVSLKGSNIQLTNLTLDNIEFKGPLQLGKIDFEEFKGNAYGGEFDIKGAVKMNTNKEVNLVYSVSNFMLNPFLSDLLEFKPVSGRTSFSGNVSSYGNTAESFVDRMILNVKLKAKDVEVDGFGLNKLSRLMFNVYQNLDELQDVQAILENKSGSTIFDEVEGGVQVSKRKVNPAFKMKGNGISGVYKGEMFFSPKTKKIEMLTDGVFTFTTGTAENPIPLSFAVRESGTLDSVIRTFNMMQVETYIDKAQEYYESYQTQ